jgi:hypothetical protein
MPPTKDEILKLLTESDRAVERAVLAIYARQTADERAIEATTMHNGMGFGAFDAEFLTSLAKRLESGRHLTPEQMKHARKKMLRYTRQLIEVATLKAQDDERTRALEIEAQDAAERALLARQIGFTGALA